MTRPLLHALPLLLLPLGSASAIEDGFDAAPCAWPEVVRVFAGQGAVDAFDGPAPTLCTGVYIGGHTVLTAASCVEAAPAPHEVHWGERLDGSVDSVTGLRMSIPLDDCRIHPSLPVAACTLREMPSMQAIPLLAPCEVDEVMVMGAKLFTVGLYDGKRWASAALALAPASDADEFELPETVWATTTELSSQVLQPSDVGGPLYVRAPDGSLRLAGIALAYEPSRWQASWPLIEWLLEFELPEVVLPCHAPDGVWSPSPACAQLIADRSSSAGAWGRGPQVCRTQQLVTPTPTCG